MDISVEGTTATLAFYLIDCWPVWKQQPAVTLGDVKKLFCQRGSASRRLPGGTATPVFHWAPVTLVQNRSLPSFRQSVSVVPEFSGRTTESLSSCWQDETTHGLSRRSSFPSQSLSPKHISSFLSDILLSFGICESWKPVTAPTCNSWRHRLPGRVSCFFLYVLSLSYLSIYYCIIRLPYVPSFFETPCVWLLHHLGFGLGSTCF